MKDFALGFSSGLARGASNLSQTLDSMEKIRQQREEMRLRFNQDARIQESHEASMKEVEFKLAELEKAQFKSDLYRYRKALELGTIKQFPPELTQSPYWQQSYGNFNVALASTRSAEELKRLGLPEGADPRNYAIFTDNQGQDLLRTLDSFDQVTGFALEKSQEDAAMYKNLSDASNSQQLLANEPLVQAMREIFLKNFSSMSPDDALRFVGAIQALSQDKQPSSFVDRQSFASKDAQMFADLIDKIQKGDLSDPTLNYAVSMAADKTKKRYLMNSLVGAIESLGVDLSQPFEISDYKDQPNYSQVQRLLSVAQGLSKDVGDSNEKRIYELIKGETPVYMQEIANMNKSARRNAIETVRRKATSYIGDQAAAQLNLENMEDDRLSVLSQLLINAYGHEKFGSALTATESAKIDAVFGTGWQNTYTFLRGAREVANAQLGQLQNIRNLMGEKSFNLFYGKIYNNLMKSVEGIDSYIEELTGYNQWIEKQKAEKGLGTDITYKTYQKSKQDRQRKDQAADEVFSALDNEPQSNQKGSPDDEKKKKLDEMIRQTNSGGM